jgi:hypothetical protein
LWIKDKKEYVGFGHREEKRWENALDYDVEGQPDILPYDKILFWCKIIEPNNGVNPTQTADKKPRKVSTKN